MPKNTKINAGDKIKIVAPPIGFDHLKNKKAKVVAIIHRDNTGVRYAVEFSDKFINKLIRKRKRFLTEFSIKQIKKR